MVSGEDIPGRVLALLREEGAEKHGHIVGTHGGHLGTYVDNDTFLSNPELGNELGGYMAEPYAHDEIAVVVSPEQVTYALAHWVAFRLKRAMNHVPIRAVYASKRGDAFRLKPVFAEMVCGKRILIVEDKVTTGGTVAKVAQAVRDAGGIVVGAVALITGGDVTQQMCGVERLASIATLPGEKYSREECEERGPCSRGVPVDEKYGHPLSSNE